MEKPSALLIPVEITHPIFIGAVPRKLGETVLISMADASYLVKCARVKLAIPVDQVLAYRGRLERIAENPESLAARQAKFLLTLLPNNPSEDLTTR